MEMKAYTLVLKGHIALSKAVFPKGTNGMALDTLARQFLWAEGLDYRHGTGIFFWHPLFLMERLADLEKGHGVGSFLVGVINQLDLRRFTY